jgi:hypothetical protein
MPPLIAGLKKGEGGQSMAAGRGSMAAGRASTNLQIQHRQDNDDDDDAGSIASDMR